MTSRSVRGPTAYTDDVQNSHTPDQQTTILDVAPLSVAPKILPPKDQMLPHESLRLWDAVTQAILSRQFSRATNLKVELEEAQREKARERERAGTVWKPVFFEHAIDKTGKPELSQKGREVLDRAQRGEWSMAGIVDA